MQRKIRFYNWLMYGGVRVVAWKPLHLILSDTVSHLSFSGNCFILSLTSLRWGNRLAEATRPRSWINKVENESDCTDEFIRENKFIEHVGS